MALPVGTIDDPSADQPTFWPAHLHIWCDNFKRELRLPGHIFNARVNGDLLTVEPRAPMISNIVGWRSARSTCSHHYSNAKPIARDLLDVGDKVAITGEVAPAQTCLQKQA